MGAALSDRYTCRLEYFPGGEARIVQIPDVSSPGPYGIELRCWLSLVNAGTDRNRLRRLEAGGIPIVPTGVAIGKITAVGAAAASINPGLVPGQWIVAKAPHANRLRLDALTDDFVCLGLDRPAPHLLLARYANIAAKAMRCLHSPGPGSLAVLGLGPLGHICIHLAAKYQVAGLTGIDRHPFRRELIRSAGHATCRLLPALPRDELFDVLVVAAPLQEPGERYLTSLNDGGCLILLAGPDESDIAFEAAALFRRSLAIIALHERHSGDEGEGRGLIAGGISALSELDLEERLLICYLDQYDVERSFRDMLENSGGNMSLSIRWDKTET